MARTRFERRFQERMSDPEFATAYREARTEIDAVDAFVRGLTPETHGNGIGIGFADVTTTRLVRELDAERQRQGLTKAELARRSGLPHASVRRLLTSGEPDPKLSTMMILSITLGRPLSLLPAAPKANGRRSQRAAVD